MMCKGMITPTQQHLPEEDKWVRKNIFRTKCDLEVSVVRLLLTLAILETQLQWRWLRIWVSMTETSTTIQIILVSTWI